MVKNTTRCVSSLIALGVSSFLLCDPSRGSSNSFEEEKHVLRQKVEHSSKETLALKKKLAEEMADKLQVLETFCDTIVKFQATLGENDQLNLKLSAVNLKMVEALAALEVSHDRLKSSKTEIALLNQSLNGLLGVSGAFVYKTLLTKKPQAVSLSPRAEGVVSAVENKKPQPKKTLRLKITHRKTDKHGITRKILEDTSNFGVRARE